MAELAPAVNLSKSSRWAVRCLIMEGSTLAEILDLLVDSRKEATKRLRCGMILPRHPVAWLRRLDIILGS